MKGGQVAVHALGATDVDAIPERAAVVADLARLLPAYLLAEWPAAPGDWPPRTIPTAALRAGDPSRPDTTGWPTVVLTTVVLGGVGWFVVLMAQAGEVGFAAGTAGLIGAVTTGAMLRGRAAARRRREGW